MTLNFMQWFGEKVHQRRTQRSLTLTELNHLLGVHNTFMSQLEKGRKIPNAEMILKVVDTFDVTTNQLRRDELDWPDNSHSSL